MYPVAGVQLDRYDPEDLRRKVVEGGAESFAEGLIAALKPRIHCELCEQKSGYQRWAFNLFAKVAKLAQADAMVLIALLGKIGARDESELMTLVESGKRMRDLSAGDLSHEQAQDDAEATLRLVWRQAPQLKAACLARLSSGAVEASGPSTNGESNGNH